MSLSENLYNLGALMKTNLEEKGIDGLTGNEGLTTLANKIRDITCKTEEENALILAVKGGEITLGLNQLVWEDDIIIDWGDETTTTKSYPNNSITHEYSDGIEEHTIRVIGALTQIGYHAFYMDTNLTSIIIPSSVTEMGMNCFYRCSNLKKVVIPSSVTSMDECFLVCSNLIDYQLFWESSPIQYNSRNMPNNTDTVFTIPVGTTQLYIDAGYPSAKLRERHEYELYVTKDKKIIQTSEDVTLIGMLIKDGEAAVGETLTYQVLHNGSIVDSGSSVTDSNGLAEITYTGTGVGDVDVIVSYGSLLQEIFVLQDCMIISSDDSTFINYLKSSNSVSITQDGEYVALTTNTNSNGNYCGLYWSNSSTTVYGYTLNDFLGGTFKVDMEVTDLSTSYWQCNVYAYIDGGFTTIASSSISDGDNSIEFTVPNDADRLWIRLQTSNRWAEYTCKTRNWRIYPV